MPEPVKKWLQFLISIAGLITFLYLYYVLFKGDWSSGNQPTDNFLLITSLVTGLVSGVVANMLGVKVTNNGGVNISNKLILSSSFMSLIGHTKAKMILAVFYVIGYLVMVAWAITIWIGPQNEYRPQIIDGLAAVGVGIVIAVATNYMGNSSKKS